MISFKNDSPRLKREYEDLNSKNPGLLKLINDLGKYCQEKHSKTVVLTMILRTKEEQDAMYKGKINSKGIKYDEKPWKSPHQFWHSCDVRSSTFTKDQVKDIEDYINNKYNKNNYYKWTAKCHDVGLGDHFHIQYVEI